MYFIYNKGIIMLDWQEVIFQYLCTLKNTAPFQALIYHQH